MSVEEETQNKIAFIKNELINKILSSNDDLKTQKLINSNVSLSDHLDGFMSAIVLVDLVLECQETKTQTTHCLIVKLMKGDIAFRTTSRSYTQFANEIHIYSKVIPAFQKLLHDTSTDTIIAENWVPRVYFADYDLYPSLSNGYESILVMQHMKTQGFRSGPRLDLDEDHLMLMMKIIAEYHSLTYAMKIKGDPKLDELVKGLTPLTIEDPDGKQTIFDIIYGIGLDRFFEYLDRSPQHHEDKFMKDIHNLRSKYCEKPVKFMQKLIRQDPTFSVVLHGDFNRNNMLFQYPNNEGFDKPMGIRMIDFQEIRYASPAIDLSFCMYMNMTPELQEKMWNTLLKYYHDTLTNSLCSILKCNINDPMLNLYSFENFYNHFTNFAFYGAMISIHFLPYMMCSEEECSRVSSLFEKDMKSKEFRDCSMIIGGDEPNNRMTCVAKHASKMGYMKIFE